jgi:biopolymer transport protein ExbD
VRLKQRRYKREPLKAISELNMTPMMDVTFLMLIAFLVTYPLMENSRRIRLPHATTNKVEPNKEKKVHHLSINSAGELSLDKNALSLEALEADLAQRMRDDPQTAVLIYGDESLSYAQLMKVMAVLNKVKVAQMGLQTYEGSAK